MKITIEMSDELVSIDGVTCRIWNGHAENGVPVRVYVHRVAVPIEIPMTRFQQDLTEQARPLHEERVPE